MRYIGFFNILGIFTIAVMLALLVNDVKTDQEEFEGMRLSVVIDRATDAAAEEMLRSQDLRIDYTKNLTPIIDPKAGMDGFLDILILNYGYKPTQEEKERLSDLSIATAAVLTNEGYYVFTKEPYGDGSSIKLIPSIKLPYLEGDVYYKLTGQEGVARGEDNFLVVGTNKDKIYSKITNIVFGELNKSLAKYDIELYSDNKDRSKYSIISNRIEGISFLAVVNNLKYSSYKNLVAGSLGGSKISTRNFVVGFTHNGVKYYTYRSHLPTGKTIEGWFYDVADAAQAGYAPHLDSLLRGK